MCGILITRDFEKRNLINHRGTKTEMFIREDSVHGNEHLIHRCLPMQTQVPGDNTQPIRLNNGNTVLYVGEIYNYDSSFTSDVDYLRYCFNNNNDLIVMNQMSKSWDGCWAIVYVQSNGCKSFVTDQLGKKQLYFNQGNGEICSEILPLVNEPYNFDLAYKSSVRKWGYNTNGKTPWYGIERALPGCYYFMNAKGKIIGGPSEFENLWNTVHKSFYINDDYKEELYDLLESSLLRRLTMSTGEVGLLLSGGLDSSILAALAVQNGFKPRLFTVQGPETEKALRMADFLQQDVEILSCNDFSLSEVLKANETPIDLGSMIPQYQMSKALKEVGINVCITGDGADELFGGYKRNLSYDSQYSDIFEELPYYHLPRLDRIGMSQTVEIRSPFLSQDIVRLALQLSRNKRTNKNILKQVFGDILPQWCIDQEKTPLKSEYFKGDSDMLESYRQTMFIKFYNEINWEENNHV